MVTGRRMLVADQRKKSTARDLDPVYIVRLKDPPVAAYSGGIGGYPTTAPATTAANALGNLAKSAKNAAKQFWKRRAKLNVRAPSVKAFVKFLKNQQKKIAQDAGVAANKLIHSYTHVENGFAAVLSPKQVRGLQNHPDVAAVTQSVRLAPSTTHSPQFLRLPQTLWKSAGGEASAGEDVVIGVVDTGIWPEHASFANTSLSPMRTLKLPQTALPLPAPAHPRPRNRNQAANPYGDPPKTFMGECEPTPDFPRTKCNGKLVGARYFNAAFYKQTKGKIDTTEDYSSARDSNGHGTWCARYGVLLDGEFTISGMAPRARLAAYKVFWRNSDGDSWANFADVNAAIDSAVMDGVDVISLSLGGVNPTGTYFDDMASLNALAAGVVVAFAAGNAGSVHPAKGEYRLIDNFAPWYLNVGASFSESPSDPNEAPILANFSSTGPLTDLTALPVPGRPTNDILKPDIIAPGVKLWGADISPSLTDHKDYFKRLSGTSMATAHVAGIAALIIQQKPMWTPAQVMSAIMTTASV
ncbi:unnamed protein product [Closterium sp. NIES-64]|nr:unnamed protein product [Closterium sp. NIES-64]